MEIRRATEDDLSPEAFATHQGHLTAHDGERCFVAEEDGRVVGFTAALVRGRASYLASLFVLPEHQGRGVGKRLLELAWGKGFARLTARPSPLVEARPCDALAARGRAGRLRGRGSRCGRAPARRPARLLLLSRGTPAPTALAISSYSLFRGTASRLPGNVWELIFMMLILKIPIVYLCAVVYWAIKAEPQPPEAAALVAREDPPTPFRPPVRRRLRPRRPGPRGGPVRTYARTRRAALARAEAER